MSGHVATGTFRRSAWPPRLVIGASVVSAIVALAIIGPSIAPYDPTSFAVRVRLMPPSATHWFGTDEFGRDVLSRVLSGAHYSLAIGFGATAICLALGVSLGQAAAFHRGVVEAAIMRTVDNSRSPNSGRGPSLAKWGFLLQTPRNSRRAST
jgi:peptide/nickel transport system permease protein